MSHNKIVDTAISISFYILISLPPLLLYSGYELTIAGNENRNMANLPEFTSKSYRSFPKEFESFFNDHFGFRNHLIHIYTNFKINWVKSPIVSKTIIGKDGWLFFAGDDVINDYRCTKPFTESKLKEIGNTLTERKIWLNDLGMKFIVVIVPNKHTIYSEYLPYTLKPVGEQSRYNQIKNYLDRNTEIELIDLRPSIMQGKKHFPTYRNTDTHWTEFGALIAVNEIIKRLHNSFPEIKNVNFDDYTIQPREISGDLERMLNMETAFAGRGVSVKPKDGFKAENAGYTFSVPLHLRKTVVKETGNSKLPRVLVFRDSFSDALVPLLSEYFSRSVYVWCYDFLPDIVEAEKPDIVIFEIAERLLDHIAIQNPFTVRNRLHPSNNNKATISNNNILELFETFDSTEPQNWVLKKGANIKNSLLSFDTAPLSPVDVCLITRLIQPKKNYRFSIRVRKTSGNNSGWLLMDFFNGDRYDNPEQEILIPVKDITQDWFVFSKSFNSEDAPDELLFRIVAKTNAPLQIDWVKVEMEKDSGRSL